MSFPGPPAFATFIRAEDARPPAALRAAGLGLAALCLLTLSAGRPALADAGDDQFAVAAAHYRQAHWDLAVVEFEELLERDPQHPRSAAARFFLAEALVQLGRYDAAAEAFQALLAAEPDGRYAEQAQFRLGEAAYLAQQYELAQKSLTGFVANHADSPLAAYALPYLAAVAEHRGDLAAARELYQQVLDRYPTGPRTADARLALARLLARQGDPSAAERVLAASAADGAATNPTRAFELASARYAQGKFAEAAQGFAAVARASADPGLRVRATLGQAWSLFQAADADAAEPLFQAVASEPKYRVEAEYGLALVAKARGDHQAARARLESIVAEAGKARHRLHAATCLQLGDCLLSSGEAALAEAQFSSGFESAPEGRWAADLWLGRMRAAQASRDDGAVLRLGAEFPTRFPESPLAPLAAHLMARAQLRLGRPASAAETLRPQVDRGNPATQAETRLLLAQALAAKGDPAGALGQLEALPKLEAPALRVRVALHQADVLAALERHVEAAEVLARCLAEAGPPAPALEARLALEWARNGRVPEALALHARAWEAAAADETVRRLTLTLAEELLAAGEAQAAAARFELLAADGLPAELQAAALSGAGRCELELQNWTAALERFQVLLERHPDSAPAADAALAAAHVLERLGQPDAALHQYDRLLAQAPSGSAAPRALLAAARLHGRLGQFRDAAAAYSRLLDEFPLAPQADAALYGWAWIEQEQGHVDRALELFARVHREHPQSRYWADATYRMARQAVTAQDQPTAEALLATLRQRLPADAPLRPHVQFLQAQGALEREDWPAAEAALEELLSQSPQSPLAPTASFWLAEAAYRQANWPTAGQRFDALEELPRDGGWSWRSTVTLRRAQVRGQQERWREALAIADTIPRDDPQSPLLQEVHYLRGRALAGLGEFQAAREAYGLAIQAESGRKTETAAMAQWMIGETWFHQQNYGRAVREYLRGETLYAFPRWQAASLLQAGKCYELLGERRRAKELYERLVAQYDQPPFAAEARERLAALEPAMASREK